MLKRTLPQVKRTSPVHGNWVQRWYLNLGTIFSVAGNGTIGTSPMRTTLLTALVLGILLAAVSRAQEVVGAPLEIVTARALPKAVLTVSYETKLAATGGVPPRTWEVIAGSLPPGLSLDSRTGTISGTPTALGQYHFAVEVSDSDDPADTRTREFTLTVISALVIEWKSVPAVTPDGIAGSVKLANQTGNDFDLTMIVVAVNEIGKAFVLGYQLFTFPAQSTISEIPFGSSLPHGDYIVHADVIAEVPATNTIHRARLQTSEPLQTH
jgi:hypothetical protein